MYMRKDVGEGRRGIYASGAKPATV